MTISTTQTKFGEFLYANGATNGRNGWYNSSHELVASGGALTGSAGGAGGAGVYETSKVGGSGSRGGNSGAMGGSGGSYSGSQPGARYMAAGGGGGGGARMPSPADSWSSIFPSFSYVATASKMSSYKGGTGAWACGYYDEGWVVNGAAASSYPSFSTSNPVIYGGGCGGGGNAAKERGDDYPFYSATGGAHSTGSPAAIIIEKGV